MEKLSLLGLDTATCLWILDFLTERPQSVRVGKSTSDSITLSTGAPQGCVLSPLLFTLLIHDCVARFEGNQIINFADDTTVVGIVNGNDESSYREEVKHLEGWCSDNNLLLNVDKTKEMIVDFRKSQPEHTPLSISGAPVERVENIKFLGVQISDKLTWSRNTTGIVKRAQQKLYFLRKLKKASLPSNILTTFYRGTIESLLTYCITTWYPSCNTADMNALHMVVRGAEKIIGVSLPSIQDLFQSRCLKKAQNIVEDSSHPLYKLFVLLPSGKRFQSISENNYLLNSFNPQAVRMLNS